MCARTRILASGCGAWVLEEIRGVHVLHGTIANLQFVAMTLLIAPVAFARVSQGTDSRKSATLQAPSARGSLSSHLYNTMDPDKYCDSTDRTPKEYFLFAVAVVGFFMAVYGLVLSSAFLGLTGLFLLLLSVSSLGRQPEP